MPFNIEDYTVNPNINFVFDRAIDQGRFRKAGVEAKDYMYMHTKNGKDHFKNIITREYLS